MKKASVLSTQPVIPYPLLSWVEASNNKVLILTPEKIAFLKAVDAEMLKSHQKQALYTGTVDTEALKMPPEQIAQVKHLVLLTMKQTAALLNVTVQYLYKVIAEGKFPAPVKMGRMTRFRLTDLEQYLDALTSQNNTGY